MEITRQIVDFLRTHGFPEAVCGALPALPDACVAVIGEEIRPAGHYDGSRVRIELRGASDTADVLAPALEIASLLQDYSGLLTPEGGLVRRIALDGGVREGAIDENRRPAATLYLHAWHCPV